MEGFLKHNLFLSLLLVLFFSYSGLLSHSLAPAGTIERVVKQQVLASLPPLSQQTSELGTSQMFLASPSGKYSAYLLRRQTSFGAGGFGNDFCYIQVQEEHGASVWESECTSVSNVNTCTLVFSEGGLEIFDGSNSAWDNDVEGDNYLRELVLIDRGDMQIIDKEGELAWRASDNPIVNQNCGSIGAPGLAPALPPFASPVHGEDDRGPFGQPLDNNVQQLGAGSQQTAQLAVPRVESQQTEADIPQQSGLSQPDELQAPAQQPGESQAPVQQPEEDLSQPDELQAPVQQPQASQAHQQGTELNTPDEFPQPEEDLSQPGEDLQEPDSSDAQPATGGLSAHQPLSPSVHHYQPATAFGGGAASTATHGMQQPLIDNTPFDSGSISSMVINQSMLGMTLATLVSLCFSGFFF